MEDIWMVIAMDSDKAYSVVQKNNSINISTGIDSKRIHLTEPRTAIETFLNDDLRSYPNYIQYLLQFIYIPIAANPKTSNDKIRQPILEDDAEKKPGRSVSI